MTLDELMALVVEVKPSLAGQTFSAQDSLMYDLGLDSLDLLQLGRRIQRSTGLPFVMQDWLQAETERGEGKQFTIESALTTLSSLSKDG